MISQTTIEKVLQLDISEVIGRYVQLKRTGKDFKACCPFHDEKTPSFSVSPSKSLFKCFGCGKGGNAIGFVMELKHIGFPEAVRKIASDHGIDIEEDATKETNEDLTKQREALFLVNQMAADYFRSNLQGKALEYVKGRWSDESISTYMIGYAPDGWDGLKKWSDEKGIKEDRLLEAGLLSESKDKVFDFFRNRIIFPVINRSGRIVGFSGRDFSGDKDQAKYINTRETAIFSKGKLLYGINTAYRSIKEKGYVHLVEGNPDVIRLQEIGKLNTVGTGGTALTSDQIEEIKRLCGSVTLIGDSDSAGQKAVMRSGEIIIKAGLFCNVIPLPAGDEKNDPDSYFGGDIDFDKYAKEHLVDFIIYLAHQKKDKAKSPDFKSRLIDDLSGLIVCLPSSSHDLYVEQLGSIIKPAKAWKDKIRGLMKEEPAEDDTFRIPEHISLSDFEKYGFYADGNRYYFKTKSGVALGSNFVMEPLFHISSVINAKRLYRITNEHGFSQVIEIAQKDLISLAGFKLRVEGLGNFLWKLGEIELNRLKSYLYEQTKTCFEITQLGWQKQGFWAWCNGIYNGSFKDVDENGIVQYADENFYLPASSNIYASEATLFVSERRFAFKPGKITLGDYSKHLIEVFGENAIVGICFYLASLFRDHIFKLFGFFPLLNLFGQFGSGKTELATSLLQFFGHHVKGPNLTNTTKAAVADHVSLFSNCLCHIDEYKNNIEYEKIEFLKGLWDGTGRTRMNMDKDRKKETTTVDCGIIVTGQEMPTADIALYSRLIFVSFTKNKFTEEERANFNYLKEVIEKVGLTHITHQILTHRELFCREYLANYKAASEELTGILDDIKIEDRIFRNWLVIISAFRTLQEHIQVPWSYEEFLEKAKRLIIQQQHETKKSNELSVFWAIVEYLVQDGQIKEEVDFKLDYVNFFKSDIMDVQWTSPKTVMMLNHSRVFQLYRIHGNKTKEPIIPIKTLEYYLQHSPEYLGRKMAVAFRVEDHAGRIEQDQDGVGGTRTMKRKVTTAYCFDYEKLGISIHQSLSEERLQEEEKIF